MIRLSLVLFSHPVAPFQTPWKIPPPIEQPHPSDPHKAAIGSIPTSPQPCLNGGRWRLAKHPRAVPSGKQAWRATHRHETPAFVWTAVAGTPACAVTAWGPRNTDRAANEHQLRAWQLDEHLSFFNTVFSCAACYVSGS